MRLATLLPRAVMVALIWVLATAAFTLRRGHDDHRPLSPSPAAKPARTPELVVPSVTGQAYVFAKGILEDGGFAWRVTGAVRGYAANRVLTQSPAAGTARPRHRRADDRAAPRARRLRREHGRPVDTSPYRGTDDQPRRPGSGNRRGSREEAGAPSLLPSLPSSPSQPKRKPVAKAEAEAEAHRQAGCKPPARVRRSPARPKEPVDEITLPARALRLEAWLANRPKTR